MNILIKPLTQNSPKYLFDLYGEHIQNHGFKY